MAARRQDRGELGSVVRLDMVDFATWLMARRDAPWWPSGSSVHPDTIRYGLRKGERIVGEPMTSARVVANRYLALQGEVFGRRSSG